MNTLILSSRDMVDAKKAQLLSQCAALSPQPHLLILRDNDDPVIEKYVSLKQRFGQTIGVTVTDQVVSTGTAALRAALQTANQDSATSGIIIQLPLRDRAATESLCQTIVPAKDVDGLGPHSPFLPATVKAILDLLAYFDISLADQTIAVVGRGKLVGAPLFKALEQRQLHPQLFHRGSDLNQLKNCTLIITATGVPGLITNDLVSPGTILVDAGTASEKGVLRGDLDPALYDRTDLAAITPRVGGVGPATVACLFENLLAAHTELML